MAVAAFKSNSRRTQIGPQDTGSTSTCKSKSDASSSQKGGHRRTRSLSDFSRHFPEISSPSGSSLTGQIDAGSRRDNPLFQPTSSMQDFNPGLSDFRNMLRGSTVPEASCTFLQPSKEDSRSRRGRSLSRCRADGANGSQFEAKHVQRRGRSVSRHQSIDSQNVSNQKVYQGGIGRRRRSLSCCQYDDSESDMDTTYNGIGHHRLIKLGIIDGQRHAPDKPTHVLPMYQRQLRRCSSPQDPSQSLDGYSSCVSVLTDDEGSAVRPDDRVEEKTIRAVYEQMKSFQSDHPTGDMDAVGLYEAMRSEVRRAVAEIRFDLEQAVARKNPASTTNNGSNDLLESKSGDIQGIVDIRKEYATKLEQSERRARGLWTQLAVEEQRCQELARIVRELLPDTQLSRTQKTSRTRKNSAERKQMSECLTEEAQNYIDEFVSMSNLEDSEMSSLEEMQHGSSIESIKTEEKESCQASIQDISYIDIAESSIYSPWVHAPSETDGVVLPWLKWETNNHNGTRINGKKMETPKTGNEAQQSLGKKVGSSGNYSSCGSNSLHATSGKSSNGRWSTDSSSRHNTSSFNLSSTESIMSASTWNSGEKRDKKYDHDVEKNMRGFKKVSQEGTVRSPPVRSGYQDDEFLLHACNEDILIEKMKLKKRVDSGGLLLCGSRLL